MSSGKESSKRSLQEIIQRNENEDTSSPKRLRGGGDDEAPEQMEYMEGDLYDEDFLTMQSQEDMIPEELLDPTMPIDQKWSRPSVNESQLSNKNDLNLQWLDMDMFGSKPLKKNPNRSREKIEGAASGQVPVIRVFGVTETGHSAAIFIHGFTPYGYFALPPNTFKESDFSDDALGNIREEINKRLGESVRGVDDRCLGVRYVGTHRSLWGYETPYTQFLQVYVAMPTMIPPLKRIMEGGIIVSLPNEKTLNSGLPAFECNVPFILRYMIDHKITGAGWLTLPKETFEVKSSNRKQTHCQIEVDVTFDDIIVHQSEGEWNKIAPLRILSFDIECQGRKGHFPSADHDPVIQIANTLTVYGEKEPMVKTVFTLKGCLPIVGAQVFSSETEEEMLMKWRDFVQATDADIITGYNVQNFDIPYLLNRAEALSKGGKRSKSRLSGFALWGRVKNSRAKMRNKMFESAAYGRRENVETTIDGRVIFDLLPYMQRNYKLSSYTLNSVSTEYLGDQKEDVHHSIISDLQNGSDEDRHRLATYCLKDSMLPQMLMDKLSILVNFIEMARVTGVPMTFLINRGQQIKVFSMLARKCREEKLLVPTKSSGGPGGETYDGATVLEPMKDYYEIPIATLDFASLYPSIMQAYNLCYSTMVNSGDLKKVDSSLYRKSENGHVFVHSHVKKGILPTILEELLAARKRAKKDMKNAPTTFERAVQNGRQLALKVSANSVYGFTGAVQGILPCVPIASSVTSYGRMLLEKTKEFVEAHYTKSNGYEHDATVIYGDTDSVMVKFGPESVKDTFELAIEAAEKASKIFPRPIELEFEKVYLPYLLMNKKRYAGLMWTNVNQYDKMDSKGLETVRRDNCALVRDVIQTSLDKMLIHRDVPGAIDYVKSKISDLLQNKMDISQLVITKSLNKGAEYALGLGGKKEDYKNKQAHVELAARMRKRDAGSAPQMGDRVPYVIISGTKNAKTYEKGEDPIYVLDNNLPIDCKWYLTNQLAKPLTRIFEPIVKDVEKSLLRGDHTRKIFVPVPAARKGTMTMFTVKSSTCLGCKAPVDASKGYLCKYCAPREAEIFLEKLQVMREAELRYSKLWAAAQRIHGTVHSDIMCTGDGCACEFYRRKKVQTDIKVAQETLDKFGQ